MLEHAIRDDLDAHAPRRMAVLRPLKVVIGNLPTELEQPLSAGNHPKDAAMGTRPVPFAREIFIDREDFAEDPPKGFKRLVPGGEVRLRNAYVIRCDEVIKDDAGQVVELRASADLDTLGSNPEGRKVKGVIHWVPAQAGLCAEVRLYDRLFRVPDPGAGGGDFLADINPESLVVLTDAVVEPSLKGVHGRRSLPVRARGLFRRRSGFDPGTAGVQSHGRTQGHLGEDQRQGLRDWSDPKPPVASRRPALRGGSPSAWARFRPAPLTPRNGPASRGKPRGGDHVRPDPWPEPSQGAGATPGGWRRRTRGASI